MHGPLLHDPHPWLYGLHVPDTQRHIQRGKISVICDAAHHELALKQSNMPVTAENFYFFKLLNVTA